MVVRGFAQIGPVLGALLLCQTQEVFAQDEGENLPTSSSFRSTTYARLFGRATTLGQGGAIVTENQLPVVEHVSYFASGIDTLLGRDTAQMEVTGWQSLDALGREAGEADLQTAHLTLQMPRPTRAVWLTLGRQIRAGGAARFSRFDGISAGANLHELLSFRAYAGYRVLPRFDQQPGYHHLGATSDVLITSPTVLEPLDRNEYSVVGGDVRINTENVSAAFSVHDETDAGAVGRRNLGLDINVAPFEKLDIGGAALLDLDALRWSSARAFVDYFATSRLLLSGQYLRAEPALLLSRQSVLSVFSTSNYQEFGLEGRYRFLSHVSAGASAFAQDYDDSGPGARISADLRFDKPGRGEKAGRGARTFVTGYTRVLTLDGGYHSARGALSQELAPQWTGTLQSFLYLYDVPIAGRKASTTHAITVDYEVSDSWEVLFGGSLASSPYASLDASTQVRVSYLLDGRSR